MPNVNTKEIKQKQKEQDDLARRVQLADLAIEEAEQEVKKLENMFESYPRGEHGEYIDPYNGTDVTATREKAIQKAKANVAQIRMERGELVGSFFQTVNEIEDLVNGKNEPDKTNAPSSKNSKPVTKKVRPARQKQSNGNFFQNLRSSYRRFKDKINTFNPLNRDVTMGEILHAQNFEKESTHLKQNPSRLKGRSIVSEKGNEVESYAHLNRYNQTADIDFKKPIKIGTMKDGAIEFAEYTGTTVKLNENNQIDFSLPENQELLKNPTLMSEIIKQYPDSFGTIPVNSFENENNKKELLGAFNEGVNDRIASGRMGVDQNGDKRSEAKYMEDMTNIGEMKRQEYQRLMAARAGYTQEMGEEW